MVTTKNKRISAFLTFVLILSALSMCITAQTKEISGTVHDAYKASLEEKYGVDIIIDDSVKEKGVYFSDPESVGDIELYFLKEIDAAFSMLPVGFVKEVNSHFQYPTIIYRKFFSADPEDAGGWYSGDGIITIGNAYTFVTTLLHEFGHAIEEDLINMKLQAGILDYFNTVNKPLPYYCPDHYTKGTHTEPELIYDKTKINLTDYYYREYSVKNFSEDFADIFGYLGTSQAIYASSIGNGVKKPVHQKIEKVAQVLDSAYKSVKGTGFLLDALPDAPAKWAVKAVDKAKADGIIPWNIYGLNTRPVTRYNLALILQPYLYKYIDESELFEKAGITKNEKIPQNLVYDVADAEDIYLLHKLNIMIADEKHIFNANGKVIRQSAALILAKVSQLLEIEKVASEVNVVYKDAGKIGSWAKPYVDYVTKYGIMGADGDGNFNPNNYITYQELYNNLLNISAKRELYNKQYNVDLPLTEYYQPVSDTNVSVASDGYLYYNTSYDIVGEGFTGNGKYIFANGNYFEGEWVDGSFHGLGKITWVTSGSYYVGEFKDDTISGYGKYVFENGSSYEGELEDGMFHGKGKYIWADKSYYDGEWKEDVRDGYGIYVWNDGSSHEGEWKDGKRHGIGVFTDDKGVKTKGRWVNDNLVELL
ncbi:hypothetical protein FACS1894219_08810 [Clostridia bacterium]|nr:hypothetical protein FACS1894219_08810 [Clostridia bacterium]